MRCRETMSLCARARCTGACPQGAARSTERVAGSGSLAHTYVDATQHLVRRVCGYCPLPRRDHVGFAFPCLGGARGHVDLVQTGADQDSRGAGCDNHVWSTRPRSLKAVMGFASVLIAAPIVMDCRGFVCLLCSKSSEPSSGSRDRSLLVDWRDRIVAG
jgi:hypothetical protein